MVDEDLEATVSRREVEYLDIGYYVVAEVKQYRLEVVAYPIFEMYQNGVLERSAIGKPFFKDNDVGAHPVESFEQAEVALRGHVKWDGCSNWSLFGSPDVMTHFCSKEDAVNFGVLLGRLYDLAAETVPHWSS